MGLMDWTVVGTYVALIVAVGVRAGRGTKSADAHLRADRSLPAWAVVFSVLATEVSAATYIGVPESGFTSNWNYLQFAIGALIGKIIVGTVLIRLYWRLNLPTAYGFLAARVGPRTQRATATAFVFGRLIGSGVRTFIAAVAFAVVADVDLFAAIVGICFFATIYTMLGGLKAVVWTDVAQGSIFFIGACTAVVFALLKLSDAGVTFSAAVSEASAAGKLQLLNFGAGEDWLASHKPLLVAIVGGAFLTLATHGTCQENVQHLLNVRSEKGAVRSLIASGLFTFPIVAMFLSVGTVLWVYYQHIPPTGYGIEAKDDVRRIFPNFIMHVMPSGLRGLVFAGLFAAAVASLGATINAVAATWAKDLFPSKQQSLRSVRMLMAGCGVALLGIALFFVWYAKQSSDDLVNIALSAMTILYGGILGTFLCALLLRRRRDGGVMLALGVGVVAGALLFFHKQIFDLAEPRIAWPWFIPISSLLTLGVAACVPRAPEPQKETCATPWARPLWCVALVVTVASAFGCKDMPTWWMETGPTWAGLVVLVLTWKRFPLTGISAAVLSVHALILAVGAHYTYEEVPFGYWMQEVFETARNPFDRLGHCFQGITPALIGRELLLRRGVVKRGGWLATISIALALAVSAVYELIEWYAAASLGQSAEAFLGMQGDPWDAQADMLCAFCGATFVVLILSRLQQRQIDRRQS